MSDPGTQSESADTIEVRIDIACPGCEYNLRGLPGPVVDCPECGLRTDVPELAARQWDKPWYKAPGFNTLAWPAVCAYVWYFILVPMSAASIGGDVTALAVVLAGLTLWVTLMYRAYKVFNAAKGVWLALVMHPLVAGFFLSMLGLVVSIILLATSLTDLQHGDLEWVVISILAFGCFLLILWVSRRVERAIAGACIRHHLRRKPTK